MRLFRSMRERMEELRRDGTHREKHKAGADARYVYALSAQRALAWVLLPVLALGTVIIRGGHDLRVLRAEVTRAYANTSQDLGILADNAYNAGIVAARYIVDSDEMVQALAQAREVLLAAQGPREQYAAHLYVRQCFDALDARFAEYALTEADVSHMRGIRANIISAAFTMETSSYNAVAAAYNELLTGFPGGLIRLAGQAERVEAFGSGD